MEKLCRACGNELEPVAICKGCAEPIRWRCYACLMEKDSPHMHRALVILHPVEGSKQQQSNERLTKTA
jgi:hypothetical protein